MDLDSSRSIFATSTYGIPQGTLTKAAWKVFRRCPALEMHKVKGRRKSKRAISPRRCEFAGDVEVVDIIIH
jgi:hypothetical protein